MDTKTSLDRYESFRLLHQTIKNGDLKSVQGFIDANISETCCYVDKASAIAVSLIANQFDIYELLIYNGFRLSPDENLEEILKNVTRSNRHGIVTLYNRNAENPNLRYLQVLLSNCRLIHTTPDDKKRELLSQITKAFEEVSIKNENILRFVAASKNFKIFFDFSRENIEIMDPSSPERTLGKCYYSQKKAELYISGDGLKARPSGDGTNNSERDNAERAVIGTIAHELSHYVLDLLYENKGKPFSSIGNDKNQKKFDQIIGSCKVNEKQKNPEKIITRMFTNYKEIDWYGELVVRVPECYAYYANNPVRMAEIESDYTDLFNYFNSEIIPKLAKALPSMEALKSVENLNNFTSVVQELQEFKLSMKIDLEFNVQGDIQAISTNSVQLTMKSIFEVLKKQNKLNSTIFVKLDALENEQVMELVSEIFESSGKSMVVDCRDETVRKIEEVVHQIFLEDIMSNVVFVFDEGLKIEAIQFGPNKRIEPRAIQHSWAHLTEKSQDLLLKTKVDFQGAEFFLNEIVNGTFAACDVIPLDDCITGKKILIGNDLKFDEIKIYVERDFLKYDPVLNEETQEYEHKPFNKEEVFELAEENKIILLVDEPGNGKSTELKMIAQKLKKIRPAFWVVYLDLKQHTASFEKDEEIPPEDEDIFADPEYIASFLSDEILKLEVFESKIFFELFLENRVIVLMDGVDEISPSYENFVIQLAAGIKENSENQLWIATRPLSKKKLEVKVQAEAIKLMEFDAKNRRDFFEKYFSNKVDLGKFEENLKAVENFITKLKSPSPVSNPMVLHMFAKLFKEKAELQFENANLYTIFDGFVFQMIQNLCIKGSDAAKDSADFMKNVRIEDVYQKKAMEVVVSKDSKDLDENLQIVNSIFPSIPVLPYKQMDRIGLLFVDGNEKSHFIHQTFTEFFISQCIFRNLLSANFRPQSTLKPLVEIWSLIMNDVSLKMTRKFLDSAVVHWMKPDEKNEKHKKIKTVFELLQNNIKNNLPALLINEGCINLLKFISINVIEEKSLLKFWLDSEIWLHATRNNIEEDIFNFSKTIFPEKSQMNQLFLYRNQKGRNALTSAGKGTNNESSIFWMAKARENLDENDLKAFLE